MKSITSLAITLGAATALFSCPIQKLSATELDFNHVLDKLTNVFFCEANETVDFVVTDVNENLQAMSKTRFFDFVIGHNLLDMYDEFDGTEGEPFHSK